MRVLILLLLLSVATYSFDIQITNIEDRKATIYIAVFDSEEGFPSEGEKAEFAWMGTVEESEEGVQTNLTSGNYAVSVFQDIDGSGKLTRKFYGAPKEPYGMSNTFKKLKMKPNFEKIAVNIEEGETLKIELLKP